MRNYKYKRPSNNAIEDRPDAPRIVKAVQVLEEAQTSVSIRHPPQWVHDTQS